MARHQLTRMQSAQPPSTASSPSSDDQSSPADSTDSASSGDHHQGQPPVPRVRGRKRQGRFFKPPTTLERIAPKTALIKALQQKVKHPRSGARENMSTISPQSSLSDHSLEWGSDGDYNQQQQLGFMQEQMQYARHCELATLLEEVQQQQQRATQGQQHQQQLASQGQQHQVYGPQEYPALGYTYPEGYHPARHPLPSHYHQAYASSSAYSSQDPSQQAHYGGYPSQLAAIWTQYVGHASQHHQSADNASRGQHLDPHTQRANYTSQHYQSPEYHSQNPEYNSHYPHYPQLVGHSSQRPQESNSYSHYAQRTAPSTQYHHQHHGHADQRMYQLAPMQYPYGPAQQQTNERLPSVQMPSVAHPAPVVAPVSGAAVPPMVSHASDSTASTLTTPSSSFASHPISAAAAAHLVPSLPAPVPPVTKRPGGKAASSTESGATGKSSTRRERKKKAPQPGPVPSDFHFHTWKDQDGILYTEFHYKIHGGLMIHQLQCNIDTVDVDQLDDEFKAANCMYPRALVPEDVYTGNRYTYETECNNIGWQLAYLNRGLRGRKGLLQRAVDTWRNSSGKMPFLSRRAKQQYRKDMKKGFRVKSSEDQLELPPDPQSSVGGFRQFGLDGMPLPGCGASGYSYAPREPDLDDDVADGLEGFRYNAY